MCASRLSEQERKLVRCGPLAASRKTTWGTKACFHVQTKLLLTQLQMPPGLMAEQVDGGVEEKAFALLKLKQKPRQR